MTASVVQLDRRPAAPAPDPNWRLRLDAARRHTKFIKSFKLTLLLGILVLGGSVVSFVVLSAISPPPAIDPAQVAGSVRMVNPRFTGRDDGGTPFVITAQSAERPESTATATELAFPRLDFAGAEETPAGTIEAERGVYDQAAGTLDLLDGVRFSTAEGYRFESEAARVFVDDGHVVGQSMIMGEGPLGSIRAQSFEIRSNGESVVFAGAVVARLYPDAPTNAEREATEAPAPDAAVPADAAAGGASDAEGGAPAAEDASAPAVADAPAPAQLSRQGGPIDITSDTTEFIAAENLNRWSGNVRVSQGEAQLTTDTMNVYFAESEDGNSRQIDHIEVEGNVVYVTPLEIASGDHGVYLASTERIELTGDVSLIRGDSRLTGDKLVIETREGRSSITREGASTPDSRVRGVLGSGGSDQAAPPSD